jgi:hypothetical chaperone protein
MTHAAIGIDFGTTNSSVARVDTAGQVQLAVFPSIGGMTDAYRSLLYLEQVKERGVNSIKSWTGPSGIEHYLAADTKGRLIQSLKSFLSSRTLTTTDVFGRRHKLEGLIARILRDLRESAEAQFGAPIRAATVGRPVQFVGAETSEDNAYAENRLRESFHAAGFESVDFEWEPVAAAHYYESTLDHDELIMIGDFGGGTSDFSLVHVGPSVRKRGRTAADLLGNSGVGVAGDAFDAKIVRHLVSPALGAESQFRSVDKLIPAPTWVYAKLERWHHLSLLKSREVMSLLHDLHIQAVEPQKIGALMYLIRNDLGYHLHRAVQQVKCDLSNHPAATFLFSDGPIEIEAKVKRASFNEWISEELGQIERCVDSLLHASGAKAKDVDMVFLTGGTSFVPAVRRVFETRFGAPRIRAGNEFTSVARGLALKGMETRK